MTSPLPGDTDDRIDRSVRKIMQQLNAGAQEPRIRPRQAFDETATIWLIDVLPLHLKSAYHAFWDAVLAFEHYIEDHPVALQIMLWMIVLSSLLIAGNIIWHGGL